MFGLVAPATPSTAAVTSSRNPHAVLHHKNTTSTSTSASSSHLGSFGCVQAHRNSPRTSYIAIKAMAQPQTLSVTGHEPQSSASGRKQALISLSDKKDLPLLATGLQDDEVQLKHKVLQTTTDIDGLHGRRASLQLLKVGIFIEDEGDAACEALDAIGIVLNHLCAHIAHQEHKLDVLKLALKSARVANGELMGFVNSLPRIPNLD